MQVLKATWKKDTVIGSISKQTQKQFLHGNSINGCRILQLNVTYCLCISMSVHDSICKSLAYTGELNEVFCDSKTL